MARSVRVPRFKAASTPVGIPKRSVTIAVGIMRLIVGPKAERKTSLTGKPVM